MSTKNFNQLVNSSAAAQHVSNRAALNTAAKGANQEIKSLTHIYYVNQLNKLARKNEFVNGTNIRNLGNMVKQHSGERDYFTLHVFTPDYLGRPCYIAKYKGEIKAQDLMHGDIITDKRGNEIRISADDPEQLIIYRVCTISLNGMISAFRAVLAPVAADQDRAEREQRAAERKAQKSAANKAASEIRKAIREQQRAAIAAYQRGEMCIAEFAEIMSKAA